MNKNITHKLQKININHNDYDHKINTIDTGITEKDSIDYK